MGGTTAQALLKIAAIVFIEASISYFARAFCCGVLFESCVNPSEIDRLNWADLGSRWCTPIQDCVALELATYFFEVAVHDRDEILGRQVVEVES